jgi:hypothetical protein
MFFETHFEQRPKKGTVYSNIRDNQRILKNTNGIQQSGVIVLNKLIVDWWRFIYKKETKKKRDFTDFRKLIPNII